MTKKTDSYEIPRVAPAKPEERWRVVAGARRISVAAIALVLVSLAFHALVLMTAFLGARAEAVPLPQEMPVEVVQEMPAAAPKPSPEQAKSEQAKSEQAKSEQAKSEQAKSEQAKPEPAKPEVAKTDVAKADIAKPVVAKPVVETPPAPVVAAPPPTPPAPPVETEKAELEHELAELKAEQQVLAKDDAGLGPLRDSIQAIALPAVGDGADGDLVGYQSLVFSQLAKAKEGASEAARPATVGVRFSLNDDGGLVDLGVAVSSGVASLDAESLAIVRRAAPFPKPPAGAERVFSANFAYAGRAQ